MILKIIGRKQIFSILFCFILLYFFIFFPFLKSGGGIDSERKNYFKNISGKLKKLALLVKTPTCEIPDFDVWDEDVLPFLKDLTKKDVDQCRRKHYNWSFIEDDKLVINERQMELDGYSFSAGFCCYKIIERITVIGNNFEDEEEAMNMDRNVRFSECTFVTEVKTAITASEFLIVECGYLKSLSFPPAYRAFHASALFSILKAGNESLGEDKEDKNLKVMKKLEYWSKYEGERIPPNILIVGIDSTSRLNFRRKMPETLHALQEIGATEMKGFIKVGENTFPNIIPMLTGYSEDDLGKICHFNRSTPLDSCPFLWKILDEVNYLTAHSEDAPGVAIFNFIKAGFQKQPTDFYLRPLMIAGLYYAYQYDPFNMIRADATDCMGHQSNDELILSYLDSILALGKDKMAPVFSLSWATTWSHDNLNMIQLSDKVYASFLKNLREKGYLDNTILFFMGDHGYRYGAFRETLLGFYEDKLPNLWIKLPPWIEKDYPEWKQALEINSGRPTSFYTFYWTLSLILETFSSSLPPRNVQLPGTDQTLERPINLREKTFFHASTAVNTSCQNLGVPPKYCPCNILEEMSPTNPVALSAAERGLRSINERLMNSECTQLKLDRVTAAAKIDDKDPKAEQLIISFMTSPGDFRFEIEVNYFEGNESFSEILKLQRMTKLNKSFIKCLSKPELELYCYCE